MVTLKADIKSYLKKNFSYRNLENLSAFSKKANLYSQYQVNKAKKIFEKALDTPAYLEANELNLFQKTSSAPPWETYDYENIDNRAKERLKEISDVILEEKASINSFLELGCGRGMVSCMLQRQGKEVTAIDFNNSTVDERAINEGLKFIKMDASQLSFEDESFDFVFSFNCFEHFPDPEAVLKEAIRVVKVGGYIYFNFTPLFMSPWGLHAYNFINFPYPQFLFTEEVIQNVAEERGFQVPWPELNKWSLEAV